MPLCNTNNSTEMGELVPKRFCSLTNVVPVTKRDYIHSGRLTVQLIHRTLGSELQLNPTTFMSGASANISFTPATPPAPLSFSLKSNIQSSKEAENIFFLHCKCFAADNMLEMAGYEYG